MVLIRVDWLVSNASDHSLWNVGLFWLITMGLILIFSLVGILPSSVALVRDSAWLLALSMILASRKKILFNECSSCCSRLREVSAAVLLVLEPVSLPSPGGGLVSGVVAHVDFNSSCPLKQVGVVPQERDIWYSLIVLELVDHCF